MGYFNLKSKVLLYGVSARLNIQHLWCTDSKYGPWAFWVKYIFCRARGSHYFSYISVIRHFGAVLAWPDLHGCTGATLGVAEGVVNGVTFGVAVGVETGTAGFGSWVTGATICGVC